MREVSAHSGTSGRRTPGGYAWFAAMVGGWVAFFTLLLLSESSLGDLWHELRGLTLVLEGLVWLLLFPFVLALGVWDSSWEGWVRVGLVSCFALAWSFMFWPRRNAGA
jgi:hypothetical protein